MARGSVASFPISAFAVSPRVIPQRVKKSVRFFPAVLEAISATRSS